MSCFSSKLRLIPQETAMRVAAAVLLVTLTQVPDVSAQTNRRLYIGATAGVEGGGRADIQLGGVRTIGGVLGLKVGRRWSVEFEIDRGHGQSERQFDGFLFSLRPFANAEEQHRVGVFGRSVHHDLAGRGYSAQLVWRTDEPGRVNAALFAGINWRRFLHHHERTITAIGPDAGIPPDHPELRVVDTIDILTGGGYSAGVLIPVRVARELHIAPEAKFTFGGVSGSDGFYSVFRTGVRLLWGW
jgi:hypothetical protein